MKKIMSVLLILVMSVTILSGCGAGKNSGADGNSDAKSDAGTETDALNVVATIFPEYDFARAISGGKANISMLTDPGASVHSFDPSPSDIKKIQEADVFLYIGGESDEWVSDILESLDTSNMKIVRLMDHVEVVAEEVTEGMTPEEEETETDEGGAEATSEAAEEEEDLDEHIWTSPKNALLLIDAISEAMCEADSENADLYLKNAQAYKSELEEVDRRFTEIISAAKRDKIIVADKFPFRYFVDQYGLEYAAAFPGCSDQTDAGAATIAYLIETVQSEKIPYVYHVELSNKNVAESIGEQTGAGVLLLNSCENLTKQEFENGATYIDLMQANIENLKKGLNE